MAKVLTKHTPGGSFLHHFESAGVCFEGKPFKNSSAVILDGFDGLGLPVKIVGANYEPCLEVDTAAGIHGWLLEDGPLNMAVDEVSERQVLVLARGPAVIVEESIPLKDPAGTDYTQANIIAAAEAVGIQVRNIPAQTSVQDT